MTHAQETLCERTPHLFSSPSLPHFSLPVLSSFSLPSSRPTPSRPMSYMVASPVGSLLPGNCSSLASCQSCTASSACVWCDGSCLSKTAAATSSCDAYAIDNEACVVCDSLISCEECLAPDVVDRCMWVNNRCASQPAAPVLPSTALVNQSMCPLPCAERRACSACLDASDSFADRTCGWCESTASCFDWGPYTADHSLGQCKAWYRTDSPGQPCEACDVHTACDACLSERKCAWCAHPVGSFCFLLFGGFLILVAPGAFFPKTFGFFGSPSAFFVAGLFSMCLNYWMPFPVSLFSLPHRIYPRPAHASPATLAARTAIHLLAPFPTFLRQRWLYQQLRRRIRRRQYH